MIVSQNIAGLWGGVSQQPDVNRLPNQCEEATNVTHTIADGVSKRYPTEFLRKLTSNIGSNAYIHTIDRDGSEKYIVVFTGNRTEPIEVYTLNGDKKTVNYGYLSGSMVFTPSTAIKTYFDLYWSNPRQAYRAVTVADYTLISNREAVCAMLTSGVETKPTRAMIYVKTSPPTTTYNVTLNGSSVSYTTGSTISSSTISVAYELALKLIALGKTGITVTNIGSSILIEASPGNSLSVSVSDQYGDSAMLLFTDVGSNYADLPKASWIGYRIKLLHNATQDFAKGYYVEGDGTSWVESRGWGQYNWIDPFTMPHRMVRMSDGTFVVAPCVWTDRKIGDNDSAPLPSFIGRGINNLVFFRNRLGLLSGDNISFSKAGDYFNFFPFTALEVLDDDPIDISVPSNEVVTLREALPFNRNLFVRGDFQQFIVGSGDSTFTPKTAMATPTTHFSTVPYAQSVSIGSNVYFATPDGPYAKIREYFVQPETYIEDAADINIHCPRYIPSGEVKVIGCSATDFVIVYNPDTPKALYVYKFFWAGNEKAQSAWFKWDFEDDILGACVFGSTLYLILRKGGDTCLEKLELFRNWSTGLGFKVRLDGLVRQAGTYSPTTLKTTWTLPYLDPYGQYLVIDKNGLGIGDAIRVDAATFEAPGDHSADPVFIGKKYLSKHVFSTWYLKDGKDQTILDGRLQIRYASISFDNTGYLEVTIEPRYGDSFKHTRTCTPVGSMVTGTPPLQNNKTRFPVQSQNIDAKITAQSDSYLPFRLQGITYEGFYTTQAKQV